ncbi:hypothetical protein KFE25_008171 [Diacronema lutheri]|uniref:Brix domain-containing protein n=2 Tax=Diacronema lutheri TaxID=2081491 RepID=A0A8J6C9R5_DIALT|nr:hypothetical protein KFE25_008171 [Diacronema lutheri]
MPKSSRRAAQSAGVRAAAAAAAAAMSAAEPVDEDALVILVQRGITPRQRHLVRDVGALLPRARVGDKLPHRAGAEALLDACFLAEGGMRALFLPARFEDEMWLWLVRLPHGPSVRFQVINIHTVAECNFAHALRRVRPPCLLSFDAAFDGAPHLRLIRELLRATFGQPAGAGGTAPAERGFETAISFHYVDERVWLRAYDVVLGEGGRGCAELCERGPRLVLTPQRVLTSALDGAPLWIGDAS